MTRLSTSTQIAAAAVILFHVSAAFAQETTVPLDKVPKPVLDAVKARFQGAKLTGASKETENKQTVYEVEIQHKKQHIDVTLSPDGKMLLIERTITAKQLPKAVNAAIQKKYPKSTYRIIEQIIEVKGKKELLNFYEVLLVTADKKNWEVKLTPAGKIVEVESKDKTAKKKA
jgi:Putative beta-lactamase-inhibitor-like, PepSY-like